MQLWGGEAGSAECDRAKLLRAVIWLCLRAVIWLPWDCEGRVCQGHLQKPKFIVVSCWVHLPFYCLNVWTMRPFLQRWTNRASWNFVTKIRRCVSCELRMQSRSCVEPWVNFLWQLVGFYLQLEWNPNCYVNVWTQKQSRCVNKLKSLLGFRWRAKFKISVEGWVHMSEGHVITVI